MVGHRPYILSEKKNKKEKNRVKDRFMSGLNL